MADFKNYRVNLVTDVQDLVNANSELRATSRYIDSVKRLSEQFGRARYQSLIKVNTELKYLHRNLANVYSLAVRVSRLRIIPQVFLIDHATPVLNRLLKRLKEIKSYFIVATANVKLKVSQSQQSAIIPKVIIPIIKIAPPTVKVAIPEIKVINNIETSSFASATSSSVEGGTNNQPLIDALTNNTTAINNLIKKLDSLQLGGATPEKPKGLWGKIKGFFDHSKQVGDGVKGAFDAKNKGKKLWSALKDYRNPGGSLFRKTVKATKRGADFLSAAGGAGSNLIGGISGWGDDIKGLWSSIMGDSPTVAPSTRIVTEEAGSGLLKGGLKAAGKLLGPLSLIPDAFDFMKAQSKEERGAAIGSAVGGIGAGILGGTIGSIIPGIGTAIVGAAFATGGSMIGREFGRALSGMIFPTPNPSSVTKDINGNNTMVIPDLSNLTGIPYPPNKNMLAPKPSFADRYVTPVWENNMKSRVNNPAPSIPPQSKATELNNKTTATASAKTSVQSTVQISDGQMGTLSGMLKDFKAQVTNNVSVNVPAGAVQVTVKENKIDYDALAIKVGQRVIKQVRQALENQKPASAAGTATPAS